MLEYKLNETTAVLLVRPNGPLRTEDFNELSQVIDPFIERSGALHGLILETAHFPGWENLGAAVRHFRFVRDHHKNIKRVAIVTDSHIGDAAEHIGSHFVAATVRHFKANELKEAEAWISSD